MAEIGSELVSNPKDSQLTKLENGCKKFFSPTSKKWYFVEYDINDLMLARYEILERFLIELNFSMTAEHLTKNILNAMRLLKEDEKNDCYVVLHNIIAGIEDMRTKHIVTMWVCSVFIYREDENIKTWDKQIANEKIEDWKENFDTGFFLELRKGMFKNLEQAWSIISQTFSEFPKNQVSETERKEEVEKKYGESQKQGQSTS